MPEVLMDIPFPDRSIQTIFVPRGAPTTPKGYTRLLHEYNNLNEEYKMLTQQLQDSVKSYQEQISQNATVMNEMQETINNLKTQLMEKIPGHGTSLQVCLLSIFFSFLVSYFSYVLFVFFSI